MPVIIQFPMNNFSGPINSKKYPNINETVNIYLWPQVENEIRLYCKFISNNNLNFQIISREQCKNENIKKLIIIVESPHKDEFDSLFKPIRPLNGRSGNKFNNMILMKLDSWFKNNQPICENDVFEIHIVNPVRYQTSLYHYLNGMIPYDKPVNSYTNIDSIDENLRNEVWIFLFPNVEKDFINYINMVNPTYVVNCCTGVVNKKFSTFTSIKGIKTVRKNAKKLKLLVRQSLVMNPNEKINFDYIEDSHPCSW